MTATTPSPSRSPRAHGRWSRRAPKKLRLLAGEGPPLAAVGCFLVGYGIVYSWPEAQTAGESSFGWIGFLVAVFGIVLVPLGLLALLARTAAPAVLCAVLYWVFPTFVLYRDIFGRDLIPYTAVPLMVTCAAASLIPTLLVTAWALFGKVVPQPKEEPHLPPQPKPQPVPISTGSPSTAAARTEAMLGSGPVPAAPPPGWYVVPGGPVEQLRWWDGAAWTPYVWPPG